jgi:hypothetical protein
MTCSIWPIDWTRTDVIGGAFQPLRVNAGPTQRLFLELASEEYPSTVGQSTHWSVWWTRRLATPGIRQRKLRDSGSPRR